MQPKTLSIGLNISQIFAGICAFSNTNSVIDPKAFWTLCYPSRSVSKTI